MKMVERVIATTHEVSLKGGNRRWFERQLTANVRHALAGVPVANVERPAWRILVTFAEPVPFDEAARRLSTVFGIHSIQAVHFAGHTVTELEKRVADGLPTGEVTSFAVRCHRNDKRFPMTSVEIERHIGGVVQERTGWPVRLKDPALTIRILLDNNGFFVWHSEHAGPGGLPTGTGGRALALLSGGIDSPVSAYRMMKRGMRLDFVHFHSVPQTDPASLEKVLDLARILGRYQGAARVALVPLLPIQQAIVSRCPAELRVLLYRRFMLRLAERLAGRFRSRALITGESLGQVASQTIENMAAVEAVVTRTPILRPLIGDDKQQIIAEARRIGTYETSILPHFDCCSFLVPEHPETRASRQQLDEAERELEVDELVKSALRDTETRRLQELCEWSAIPVPRVLKV